NDIRHDWLAGGGGQVQGVDVLRSPTTGDKVTVFWRELAKTAQPRKKRSGPVLIGESVTIPAPLSVGQTVLPRGQKFAVLDGSGSVLFHSEQTHSLEENFFEESENDPALSAAVRGRSDTTLTAYYQGRKHRLYVMPLQMESSGKRPWSLVAFQDTVIPETLNLETLTLAVVMFCLYSVVLGCLWAGAYLCWRRYPVRWFWPDHSRRAGYQIALLINIACMVILLAGILVFRPVTLLIGTVLLAIGAILVTFKVVTQ